MSSILLTNLCVSECPQASKKLFKGLGAFEGHIERCVVQSACMCVSIYPQPERWTREICIMVVSMLLLPCCSVVHPRSCQMLVCEPCCSVRDILQHSALVRKGYVCSWSMSTRNAPLILHLRWVLTNTLDIR